MGRASAPCSREARPWILAAAILGSSLAFIDGAVVNVALPALQSKLNATIVDVQWVVEAYALFLSALWLIGGALGDRYGRRRTYAIGIALYALASIWCGLTSGIQRLIVARSVQGTNPIPRLDERWERILPDHSIARRLVNVLPARWMPYEAAVVPFEISGSGMRT